MSAFGLVPALNPLCFKVGRRLRFAAMAAAGVAWFGAVGLPGYALQQASLKRAMTGELIHPAPNTVQAVWSSRPLNEYDLVISSFGSVGLAGGS